MRPRDETENEENTADSPDDEQSDDDRMSSVSSVSLTSEALRANIHKEMNAFLGNIDLLKMQLHIFSYWKTHIVVQKTKSVLPSL